MANGFASYHHDYRGHRQPGAAFTLTLDALRWRS